MHFFKTITTSAILWSLPLIAAAQNRPLIVPIGGQTSIDIGPAQYVSSIYRWGVGLAALLALAMLTFGAIEYTASAGNVGSQDGAKKRMRGAILGLILLLGASLLLRTINADFGRDIRTTSVGDGGALGTASKEDLIRIRNERIQAFDDAYAGYVQAEDFLLVHEIVELYNDGDTEGPDPITDPRDLALARETTGSLFEQYRGSREAALERGDNPDTSPQALGLENELVAIMADTRAIATESDYAKIIADIPVSERIRLIKKYGL